MPVRASRNPLLVALFLATLLASLVPAIVAPAARAATGDLVISGIVDGPLPGGLPKAIEFAVVNDIPDLSAYGFGSANNGGGTDGEEYTFTGSAAAGDHLWVASEAVEFANFFGFAPTDTDNAANINGDDAIELFLDGTVVDVFGEIDVDGTGQPWDHVDGWAYRVDDTGQDATTFVLDNWTFSGTDALDGETTNATAATPFPIGTYVAEGGDGGDDPDVAINELRISSSGDSDDTSNFVELAAAGGTSLDGLSLVVLSGEFNPGAAEFVFDLDGLAVPEDGFFHLGQTDGAPAADLVADFDFFGSPSVFLVVAGTAPAVGDDLDADDDGALDAAPWDSVVDAVALVDGDANTDQTYGAPTVVPEDDFTPAAAQRCPDVTGDFAPGSFGDLTLDTPGAANTCDDDNGNGGEGDPLVVKVSDLQGSGPVAALDDEYVQVQAVVTSLFEDNDLLDAFFVQEEDGDADGDPTTSEGVFVFCRGFCPSELAVGDLVTVTGVVDEYFDMTQLEPADATEIVIDASGTTLPTATAIALPAGGSTMDAATFEATEGMVVSFPGTLAVSEYFELARYGQLVLTADERPFQFTHDNAPSVDGYAAFLDDLATRRIILDDDNNDQNEDTANGPDEPYPYPTSAWPTGGLSVDDTVRGGDTIDGLTGVLHWSFAGQSGTDAWRVRPIDGLDYSFDEVNPRTDAPQDVGGSLKVASYNVLNYFTSIDDGVSVCQAGCRGADSEAEFVRQQDKIVAALAAIDADVVGLIEIENNDTAVQDLADAVNAVVGAGTYAQVDTGVVGTDSIKVGFIYKPATVALEGSHAILDSSVDPTFVDTKNRPTVAQTFREIATDGTFTAAVNHLKSKGSDCSDIGEDESIVDGSANCSVTRTQAAAALSTWLAGDPTGSGDPDALILGDLNAYAMEDPITTLEGDGWTDLNDALTGDDAYTYVFDGQLGYLDYALANTSLLDQVTGVDQWHVNADEVALLDYNDGVLDSTEQSFERESDALPIYAPDAYRSSDHDPVVVGLDLDEPEAEYPLWDRATVYTRGDRVTYDGRVFEAGWWTRGEVPGSSAWGAWQELGEVGPDGIAAWTPSRVYDTGDVVRHDDRIFEAGWWTRNEEPGTRTHGAWQELGALDDNGTRAWTPSRVYNRGDVVNHLGGIFEAQWYTRNVVPVDSRWGPWIQVGGVEFTLTVLHNNDGESDLLGAAEDQADPGAGSISRFGWLLDELRDSATAAGQGVVTITAGDNFLASPEWQASLDRGVPFYDAVALDSLDYDAFTIGNHEFDFGPEVLADFINSFSGDDVFLTANLDFSQEPALQALVDAGRVRPSIVVDEAGEQVGIVGATTPDLDEVTSPGDVIIDDDLVGVVQAEVDALTAAGIDKILLSSHLQDITNELDLVTSLRDVDAVIGGGGGEDIRADYPLTAIDADGVTVPVVTVPGDYFDVGRLELGFDGDGNVVSYGGSLEAVTGDLPQDPFIVEQVEDPVTAYLDELATTIVATSEVGLNGVRADVRTRETNVGNLLADGLLATGAARAATYGVPEPQVALQNGGGIRNDAVIPAGDVSLLDTFDIAPFTNFVAVVPDVARADLVAAVEHGLAGLPGAVGSFGQWAGLTVEYDPSAAAGSRVVTLALDDGTVLVEAGTLVPGAPVTLATIDFLAQGQDGYDMFEAYDYTRVGVSYQQSLASHLADLGTLTVADHADPVDVAARSRIIPTS